MGHVSGRHRYGIATVAEVFGRRRCMLKQTEDMASPSLVLCAIEHAATLGEVDNPETRVGF